MSATPIFVKEFHAQGLRLRCHTWNRQDARKYSDTLTLFHGEVPSPMGPLVLVWCAPWGLCHVEFLQEDSWDKLRLAWPHAQWQKDQANALNLAQRICFPEASEDDKGNTLDLLLHGPAFHVAVWLSLLDVPRGEIVSYQELARRAGKPGAARAVGTAMSTNPLAYVVPCHRVVRADGSTGHYGGGDALKIRLLEWEAESGPMPKAFV